MFRNLIALATAALLSFHAFAAVDVNTASRADLETVKGIGPGLSAKILKAREAGTFKTWNDFVERVGGVGPGNASRFSQAGLTVGGAAFDGALPQKAGGKSIDAKADTGEKKVRKARKDASET